MEAVCVSHMIRLGFDLTWWCSLLFVLALEDIDVQRCNLSKLTSAAELEFSITNSEVYALPKPFGLRNQLNAFTKQQNSNTNTNN
jgi:hypothetical protein